MSSEKSWKRLVFRWTAPEGAAAMALFLALAIFIEYLVVFIFRSYGLGDPQTFQVPLVGFTVAISPLFHLIPFGVIIVLVSCWTYLIKCMARVPDRKLPIKKPLPKPRRSIEKMKRRRFRSVKSFSRKVTRALRAFRHRIKTGALRILGASPTIQRLFFARAATKSTASVFLIFSVSFLILYLFAYPNLIHDSVVGFYRGNPSWHGFVIGTIEAANAIGQALSPIGWLASTANGILISASSGFRHSLEGFVIYLTDPLVGLDVMWKYAICQNAAAWMSAIVGLVYGQYTTHLHRRFRR
ncbi:MAG: hypothetical protein JSW53_06360 [Candidatus Bathyarchaeota archaeon]|nr:MAG: hypothetical protein JSW53_06360 [Candidatus Bathyarchaeota archaeon]